MIESIRMWRIKCDGCGAFLSNTDSDYDCYVSKQDAIDTLEDYYETWERKGKKCFCDNCAEKLSKSEQEQIK